MSKAHIPSLTHWYWCWQCLKTHRYLLIKNYLHGHTWFHYGHFHPLTAQVHRHDSYRHCGHKDVWELFISVCENAVRLLSILGEYTCVCERIRLPVWEGNIARTRQNKESSSSSLLAMMSCKDGEKKSFLKRNLTKIWTIYKSFILKCFLLRLNDTWMWRFIVWYVETSGNQVDCSDHPQSLLCL